MASLSAVAKQAGVSVTTASMVLNGGKRSERISEGCAQRVREVARQVGYVPNYHARSMKLGRAEVLGVAVELSPWHGPQRGDLGSTYFGNLVGAIELTARKAGYSMTMIGPDERLTALRRGVQAVRQRRLDGLIVLGVVEPAAAVLNTPDLGSDLMVVVEYAGPTQLPVVDWDQEQAVRMAVGHLAELGHRNLLWLGPAPRLATAPSVLREQLFVTAVWDAGLRGSSCRFVVPPAQPSHPAERTGDAAAEALGPFLAAKGPDAFTAIVCYSDATAIGAYRALRAAGRRVPEDVSVVGFDDIEAPLMIPKLTTVDHMLHEMGRRSTEMLLEAVKEPARWSEWRGRREIVVPELVVRQSTGPVRTGSGGAAEN